MSQRNLIINGLPIHFKGLFNYDQLLDVIDSTSQKQGYIRHEKRFEESTTEHGRHIFLELRPSKSKTATASLTIKIRLDLQNLKERVVPVQGVPTSFYEGEVRILFDAWVILSINRRWEMKPVFYFLKAIFNKYIYKFPSESGLAGEVSSDARLIHSNVSTYLKSVRPEGGLAEKLP